jgi:K+-sensing histidine kinase KdpD
MEFELNNLKESNEFLNLVLENITSGVLLIDKDVRIYNINNTVKILLGKSKEKIIGKLCGNALGCIHTVREYKKCGHTTKCSECPLRLTISNTFGKKHQVNKKKLRRRFKIKGKIVNKVYQYSTRYITYNGEDMVLIILDDITKEALRERKLKKLNKLKNKFLGIAAHDIKNPVSVIITICKLAKKMNKSLTISDMNGLEEIYNSAKFIDNMISNLLDITAIESGRISLDVSKTNYTQLLNRNVSINRMVGSEKGIDIILENHLGNIYINIDRNKIEQVLNNLIYNAIKFSYSNSEIKVVISKMGNYIKTEVIDYGLGIKEEDQDKLFQPFNKTSTKPTNNERGSGLGLSIVKKIIDIHGGKIELKSTPGEGSNFTYYLPIEDKAFQKKQMH